MWRLGPWPLDVAALGLQSIVEWIKILTDPVRLLNINPVDEHAFVVYAAVVMDTLWFARNQKAHQDMPGCLLI